jgi:hypothetical protein
LVGHGLLKELCPFVSGEGDFLRCRPWQMGPVLTSS